MYRLAGFLLLIRFFSGDPVIDFLSIGDNGFWLICWGHDFSCSDLDAEFAGVDDLILCHNFWFIVC